MQVGDLVQTTITGLGKPERTAMGLLIKPIATYFWQVFLLEEKTYLCIDMNKLEVLNANR